MPGLPRRTSSTSHELHLYFRGKAEQAEDMANARRQRIREDAERNLRMRWKAQKKFFSDRDFESELRVILDGACGKDPVFKSAIADNRWYIDKSVMYGQSAAIEALLLLVERLGSK